MMTRTAAGILRFRVAAAACPIVPGGLLVGRMDLRRMDLRRMDMRRIIPPR
jgi:hypothetical protein